MFRLILPGDEEHIRAVEGHFKQRMENAKKLLELSASGRGNFVFEVLLLCCCALDAIGSLFLKDDKGGDEGKDQERFQQLLWSYGETGGFRFDRVNVVALKQAVAKYSAKKKIAFRKVQSYIESEIDRHNFSDPKGNHTETDLHFGEIEKRCHALLREDGLMDRWDWLPNVIHASTHAGVLYKQYRCDAVHRSIVRGHWQCSSQRDESPFYMPVVGMDSDFTFPETFLIKVVERVLSCILQEHMSPEVLRHCSIH